MNRLFKHSLAFVFLIGFGLASQGQTLHAILMADENDAKIGQSCRKDLKIMTENMEQISKGISYQLNTVQLVGLNFTAFALREAIQKLQVGPQDLIFFYYSGHGYNIPNNASNYPHLIHGMLYLWMKLNNSSKSKSPDFALRSAIVVTRWRKMQNYQGVLPNPVPKKPTQAIRSRPSSNNSF
jgi:hypothetical protein